MRILVTGGTGYIGSHTAVALLEAGHELVVLDNLVNSSAEVVDRIAAIAGRRPVFVQGDVRDRTLLAGLFRAHAIEAVIHFAALKAVGESWKLPLEYYDNNVGGSIALLEAMQDAGVGRFVFSSSATVYGEASAPPIGEDAPCAPCNPYARTKRMVEEIVGDLEPGFSTVVLRYFNPAGAHPSGLIGEAPHGVPNNLFPYVADVAAGVRPHLVVFGNDYPTPDGTGVRDYIHVQDLAHAHVAAVERTGSGIREVYNIGTGRGYSVLEVVAAFEAACGTRIPVMFGPRRAGDVASCYADPSRARRTPDWSAIRGLEQMCEDAWRWRRSTTGGR
jgi:UDP-glucose 4-epimerase